MEGFLKGDKLFSFMQYTYPTVITVVLLIAFAVGIYFAVKDFGKDEGELISTRVIITFGASVAICMFGNILIFSFGSSYIKNLLDEKYQQEIQTHITHLENTNSIEEIEYSYPAAPNFRFKEGDYKIVIDIELMEGVKVAEFNEMDPKLDESVAKDVIYQVKTYTK